MIENKIIIARGFDLFFHGTTESILQCIANEIDECCTYDLEEQRATMMFKKHHLIPFGERDCIHDFLNKHGLALAEKYDCSYEAGELYLTVSASVADWIVENGQGHY